MSSLEPADEVATPFKIGAGSFAAVFVTRGGPLAFNIAHAPDHETLKKEYQALVHLYSTCNKTFRIPKPVAFHNSQYNILLAAGPKLKGP